MLSAFPVRSFCYLAKSQTVTRVFIDGCCFGNGTSNAKAGIGVYFGEGDQRNLAEPLAGNLQTNQRAEISAAIRALEIAKENDQAIELFSDSKYLVQCTFTLIFLSFKIHELTPHKQ